jgi:glutamate synthase (ferredoxin)
MSGGVAFVLDEAGDFQNRCNLEMVDLEPLREPEDLRLVRELLNEHASKTSSEVATRLLENWKRSAATFVRVMPRDYRRVIEQTKASTNGRPARELHQPLEVSRG